MLTNHFSKQISRCFSAPAILIALIAVGITAIIFWTIGCDFDLNPDLSLNNFTLPETFETTGEEFLISALDEIANITELVENGQLASLSVPIMRGGNALLPSRDRKVIISKTSTDTTFLYGEITTDGYGAVVTERHAYPKGILLITVRKTHGKAQGTIVTQTKRFISFNDFANDSAQQSNITELYGLSSDTIVTHVLRNGILETYTFRLPVVTRVVNPQDGSVRVTTRYGSSGALYSVVRDGTGSLIQIRKNNGLTDGSVVAYTQYPDSSWRNVRTVGQSDGTVFREITSGP